MEVACPSLRLVTDPEDPLGWGHGLGELVFLDPAATASRIPPGHLLLNGL